MAPGRDPDTIVLRGLLAAAPLLIAMTVLFVGLATLFAWLLRFDLAQVLFAMGAAGLTIKAVLDVRAAKSAVGRPRSLARR